MRRGHLLAQTCWLALPATVGLLGLAMFGATGWLPAFAAWLASLLFSAGVAWVGESELGAIARYLDALTEGRKPEPLSETSVLGGELMAAVHRLERQLQAERTHESESGALLATVLDALPDPVLLVTAGHRVEQANRAAAELVGHDPDGRQLEASLRDPGLLAALDEALNRGVAGQLTINMPGTPARQFAAQVVPLRLGEQAAALAALRELTEQLMIERMRSDFVANASHELRTPLTALRGFIETLLGPARDDPEARERFLRTMLAETERMSRLVDDLLSLSQIEVSEHQPPEEQVDVAVCLGSVVEALRPVAERQNTTLTLRCADNLPPVRADRDQLAQLFTNLIDNAIKYGGEGGEVTVIADRLDAAPPGAGPLTGQPALRVIVQDQGPGIPPEHLPRLTERFFRVDPARSRELGSTGLGLAIVKHILRRHGGHLAIESELGQGTKAIVYLPIA